MQFTNDILEPVTEDDVSRCNEVWSCCKKKSDKTVKVSGDGKGIKLIERHMYRLKPDEWLFDEQVNAFMSILQRVDDLDCSNERNRKKSFLFHTEFFNNKVQILCSFSSFLKNNCFLIYQISVSKDQYATNKRRTIEKVFLFLSRFSFIIYYYYFFFTIRSLKIEEAYSICPNFFFL